MPGSHPPSAFDCGRSLDDQIEESVCSRALPAGPFVLVEEVPQLPIPSLAQPVDKAARASPCVTVPRREALG